MCRPSSADKAGLVICGAGQGPISKFPTATTGCLLAFLCSYQLCLFHCFCLGKLAVCLTIARAGIGGGVQAAGGGGRRPGGHAGLPDGDPGVGERADAATPRAGVHAARPGRRPPRGPAGLPRLPRRCGRLDGCAGGGPGR